MFRRRFIAVLAAITIAAISSPLARMATESFLGLGSLFVVPLLAIGTVFTITARDPLRRSWWFGFASAVGICLPLCPTLEPWLHAIALYLQRLTQQGVISLSQRIIEPALMLLVMIVPPISACLFGVVAGRILRTLVRRRAVPETDGPRETHWRFSVRELLVGLAATCLLLAWFSSHLRSYQAVQHQEENLFLAQFQDSFTSGEIKLLGEPFFDDGAGSDRFGQGVREHRILAPVEKGGRPCWGLWSYTCSYTDNRIFIWQYAYAEASSLEELATPRLPAKRYIEGTWGMIDGVPKTAGPSATVLSVTTPAFVDQPITLRCSAPPGTVCDLRLFPSNVVTPPPAPVKVGKGKTAVFTFRVPPESAGYSVSYELHCIEQRGASQMDNSTRGNIPLAVR